MFSCFQKHNCNLKFFDHWYFLPHYVAQKMWLFYLLDTEIFWRVLFYLFPLVNTFACLGLQELKLKQQQQQQNLAQSRCSRLVNSVRNPKLLNECQCGWGLSMCNTELSLTMLAKQLAFRLTKDTTSNFVKSAKIKTFLSMSLPDLFHVLARENRPCKTIRTMGWF